MKIKHIIATGLLAATAAFAFGEYPVDRPANEQEVQRSGQQAWANSIFPRNVGWGLRFAGGIFTFSGSEADYVGYKSPGQAFEFGPIFYYRANRVVEINAGLALGYRHHSYTEDDYSLSFEEYLVEIPLTVRFYVWKGIFVGGGVQLSPVLDSKNKAVSMGRRTEFSSATPEFGGLLNLGYSFGRFAVDLSLYAAATDYSDNDVIGVWKGLTYRPVTASLGIACIF